MFWTDTFTIWFNLLLCWIFGSRVQNVSWENEVKLIIVFAFGSQARPRKMPVWVYGYGEGLFRPCIHSIFSLGFHEESTTTTTNSQLTKRRTHIQVASLHQCGGRTYKFHRWWLEWEFTATLKNITEINFFGVYYQFSCLSITLLTSIWMRNWTFRSIFNTLSLFDFETQNSFLFIWANNKNTKLNRRPRCVKLMGFY